MSDNVREHNRLFEVQLPREHLLKWRGGERKSFSQVGGHPLPVMESYSSASTYTCSIQKKHQVFIAAVLKA